MHMHIDHIPSRDHLLVCGHYLLSYNALFIQELLPATSRMASHVASQSSVCWNSPVYCCLMSPHYKQMVWTTFILALKRFQGVHKVFKIWLELNKSGLNEVCNTTSITSCNKDDKILLSSYTWFFLITASIYIVLYWLLHTLPSTLYNLYTWNSVISHPKIRK